MSNVKTGIAVDESVRSAFTSATADNVRFIKVQLTEDCESLTLTATKQCHGSWEEDFAMVPEELEPKKPCFVLYRTSKADQPDRSMWYSLSYVPDNAPVKQRMLYAGCRHTLKNSLGPLNFIGEIPGTEKKDFSVAGFEEYQRHITSEAPLTAEEQLKKEERAQGVAECSGGVSYAHCVTFPVDPEVGTAFDGLRSGSLNYVQVTIDMDAEVMKVAVSGNCTPDEVQTHVPTADCAFHYYNWVHFHEGQQHSSLVFAFSCPDGSNGTKSAPVKQRMLYASSKANALSLPASKGIDVACKMDIGSGNDFSESEYSVMIHPPVEEEKKGFKKPAPRGGRRLGK